MKTALNLHQANVVKQIIEEANQPGVKVCWLYRHDSLNPARVDIVNGSRQSFEVTEQDIVTIVGQLKGDGWEIRPCVSTLGFTARKRPVNVCPHCKGHGVVRGVTEWGTIALQKCPACTPIPFMGEPVELSDDDNGNGLAHQVDF